MHYLGLNPRLTTYHMSHFEVVINLHKLLFFLYKTWIMIGPLSIIIWIKLSDECPVLNTVFENQFSINTVISLNSISFCKQRKSPWITAQKFPKIVGAHDVFWAVV